MLLLPESDLSLAIGAAANRFVIASSVLQTIIDYNRLFLRMTDGPSLAASSLSRRMHADARRAVVLVILKPLCDKTRWWHSTWGRQRGQCSLFKIFLMLQRDELWRCPAGANVCKCNMSSLMASSCHGFFVAFRVVTVFALPKTLFRLCSRS